MLFEQVEISDYSQLREDSVKSRITELFKRDGFVVVVHADEYEDFSMAELNAVFGEAVADRSLSSWVSTSVGDEIVENGEFLTSAGRKTVAIETGELTSHTDKAWLGYENVEPVIALSQHQTASEGGEHVVIPLDRVIEKLAKQHPQYYKAMFAEDAIEIDSKLPDTVMIKKPLMCVEDGIVRVTKFNDRMARVKFGSLDAMMGYELIREFADSLENQVVLPAKINQAVLIDNYRTAHKRTDYTEIPLYNYPETLRNTTEEQRGIAIARNLYGDRSDYCVYSGCRVNGNMAFYGNGIQCGYRIDGSKVSPLLIENDSATDGKFLHYERLKRIIEEKKLRLFSIEGLPRSGSTILLNTMSGFTDLAVNQPFLYIKMKAAQSLQGSLEADEIFDYGCAFIADHAEKLSVGSTLEIKDFSRNLPEPLYKEKWLPMVDHTVFTIRPPHEQVASYILMRLDGKLKAGGSIMKNNNFFPDGVEPKYYDSLIETLTQHYDAQERNINIASEASSNITITDLTCLKFAPSETIGNLLDKLGIAGQEFNPESFEIEVVDPFPKSRAAVQKAYGGKILPIEIGSQTSKILNDEKLQLLLERALKVYSEAFLNSRNIALSSQLLAKASWGSELPLEAVDPLVASLLKIDANESALLMSNIGERSRIS